MSDVEAAENKVEGWLQPLPDESAPCGVDLEYDNDFLALNQAATGKPESQFGPAEPPDWRAVVEGAEAMFERTRDLRVAILWLRGSLHVVGYGAIVPGLKLLNGMVEAMWEHLHPLPDPDDGDPYARVNALAVLAAPEGGITDLREAHVVDDRAVGLLTGRMVEVSLGLSPAREGEAETPKEQITRMFDAALEREPSLRAQCNDAVAQFKRLIAQLNDKLGIGTVDLRPAFQIVNGLAGLLPAEAVAAEGEGGVDDESDPDGSDGGGAVGGGRRRGLSGAVNSREEAIRAIDLVCEYLEKAEPTNPAPLFLRRARKLISHDFLQLLKVLAPDALHEVARVVGVDPDTVEPPEGT